MIGSSMRAGAWALIPAKGLSCGCRWKWVRRTLDGAQQPSGCPRHSITGVQHRERVTRFHVKHEEPSEMPCGVDWSADPWCRRDGGLHSRHECAVPAADVAKRCVCACGAEY